MSRSVSRRFRVSLLTVTLALGAAPASQAQVDCGDPDNLCTGNPCVIPSLTVASPCVVDFGARTVVVQGRLEVPTGEVAFQAAAFDVQGTIIGMDGPTDLSLTATGNIAVGGPIFLKGSRAGSVTLDAGGDIDVDAPITARQTTTNGLAAPSSIQLTAVGSIHVRQSIRTSARGWNWTPPIPTMSILLDAGVDINVMKAIRARTSGGVTLQAGGNIAIDEPIRAGMRGPSTLAVEAGGNIDVRAHVTILTDVTLDAAGSLTVEKPIRASGGSLAVVLRGDAGVTVADKIDASAPRAGLIEVTSALGAVDLQGRIFSVATLVPGSVTVTAAGDITVGNLVKTLGVGTTDGGDITLVSAAGAVAIDDDLQAGGRVGGEVRAEGDTVQVGSESTLDATGSESGGEVRLQATAGGLVLSGRFRAGGQSGPGGVIEGTASGNLTATGSFACAGTPDGCIALSAGGTLDTTGASFDPLPVLDCPGSPSGAFLAGRASVL